MFSRPFDSGKGAQALWKAQDIAERGLVDEG